MNKLAFLSFISIITLSSCALFKRARVHEHNAIESKEFNLPIFLYPSKNLQSKKLLIFLSGDGGWIRFEDDLSLKFAQNDFYTIGINSRDYFWERKTPEQTAHDIVQLVRKYAIRYKTDQIYLLGYSFGADVLPFVYNNLPPRAKRHIVALEMLSPFSTTDFMVHFGDLANISSDKYPHKVDLEVKKLKVPIFCFYGIDENEKALESIIQKNFVVGSLLGDHHYHESEYDKIISVLKKKP